MEEVRQVNIGLIQKVRQVDVGLIKKVCQVNFVRWVGREIRLVIAVSGIFYCTCRI
jgi:hypothetical protein